MPVANHDRINKMVMQVIDIFDHAVFEQSRHTNIVEQGNMLDIFAQADAACVGADRHTKLCRHQQDDNYLV